VAIFIPTAFKPAGSINFIVHFHGHNNHVSNVLAKWKLPHELVLSGINAILVIPQLPRDAPDSGGGKLELDQDGLRNLLSDVAAFLQSQRKVTTSTLGNVIITAHSGGYNTAAAVLHRGGLSPNITDCLPFDASYGWLEYFVECTKASPSHRLISFSTQHLAKTNLELMYLMSKSNVAYTELTEAQLSPAALSIRGPIFIPTTLAHDEVPDKKSYFSMTLATSALVEAAR